jgi:glutamate/tyrosine decarboxylase-like PLP-dependent enzyme
MSSKKYKAPNPDQDVAMQIARGTQRPGQTKEQTKLIAQGIKKGIEQYKKLQSAKSRELDRNRKKVKQQLVHTEATEIEAQEKVVYKYQWLPWILLFLSWIGMAAFLFATW